MKSCETKVRVQSKGIFNEAVSAKAGTCLLKTGVLGRTEECLYGASQETGEEMSVVMMVKLFLKREEEKKQRR